MIIFNDQPCGATFSPCRGYRFTLWRRWDLDKPMVGFIGLNPSKADETTDDSTVRRCINYARRWGAGSLIMLNLFGWRSTNPRALYGRADPVGTGNDRVLIDASSSCQTVVAAWGVHGALNKRGERVRTMLDAHGVQLHMLRLTKDGHPWHPLYLRADLEPKAWVR